MSLSIRFVYTVPSVYNSHHRNLSQHCNCDHRRLICHNPDTWIYYLSILDSIWPNQCFNIYSFICFIHMESIWLNIVVSCIHISYVSMTCTIACTYRLHRGDSHQCLAGKLLPNDRATRTVALVHVKLSYVGQSWSTDSAPLFTKRLDVFPPYVMN